MASVLDVSLTDPPLGAFLASVAARLAVEGVPIAAIARGLDRPSGIIRGALHDAFNAGAITEIPRDDWPPGGRRDRRERSVPVVADGAQLALNAIRALRLTPLEARVFSLLMRRSEATKEQLHMAIEDGRDAIEEESNVKMVDVVICHLRKKLNKHDLRIKTLWGTGYCIEPSVRKKAFVLLGMDGHADKMADDPAAAGKTVRSR